MDSAQTQENNSGLKWYNEYFSKAINRKSPDFIEIVLYRFVRSKHYPFSIPSSHRWSQLAPKPDIVSATPRSHQHVAFFSRKLGWYSLRNLIRIFVVDRLGVCTYSFLMSPLRYCQFSLYMGYRLRGFVTVSIFTLSCVHHPPYLLLTYYYSLKSEGKWEILFPFSWGAFCL